MLGRLGAALVALASAVSAQAAISVGTDSSTNEYFFVAYDTTNSTTFIQDLGISIQDNPNGPTGSASVDSLFGTTFADTSNVVWAVVGATSGPTGFSIYSTGPDGTDLTGFGGPGTAANLNNTLGGINNLTDLHNADTNFAANDATVRTQGNGSVPQQWTGSVDAGSSSLVSFGEIGATLGFFQIGSTLPPAADFAPNILNSFATISFDGSTISFGSTAVIPLPAGVWLLGSALCGLVGVARRRRQAA